MKHSRPSDSESPRPCPICSREVDAKSPALPFCSERCRLVDLGKWFTGSYSISRPLEPEDEDEPL